MKLRAAPAACRNKGKLCFERDDQPRGRQAHLERVAVGVGDGRKRDEFAARLVAGAVVAMRRSGRGARRRNSVPVRFDRNHASVEGRLQRDRRHEAVALVEITGHGLAGGGADRCRPGDEHQRDPNRADTPRTSAHYGRQLGRLLKRDTVAFNLMLETGERSSSRTAFGLPPAESCSIARASASSSARTSSTSASDRRSVLWSRSSPRPSRRFATLHRTRSHQPGRAASSPPRPHAATASRSIRPRARYATRTNRRSLATNARARRGKPANRSRAWARAARLAIPRYRRSPAAGCTARR